MPPTYTTRYDAESGSYIPILRHRYPSGPPARLGVVLRYQDGSTVSVPGSYSLGMSGLGAGSVGQTVAVSATQIAGGVASSFLAAGSALIPIIGPAVAAITLGITALFSRKGAKQKLATTKIVETVEPKMQANLQAYLSGPRTASSQAQALANFDALWAYVEQSCETDANGNPGRACVGDRESGACHYKTSPGGWSTDGKSYTAPGANNSGDACWNWFVGYREPIATDPSVVPDPTVDENGNLVQVTEDPVTGKLVSTVVGTASSSSGISSLFSGNSGLLVIGGLLVVVLLMGSGSGSSGGRN